MIAQSFVTTWKTDNPGSSNSTTITIPLNGTNITVDWGDGNSETGLSGPISHTYSSADTYTVAISGGVNFIRFDGGGDAKKLLTIEEWGDIDWTSFQDAFRGCSNLQVTATDAPDLSGLTVLRRIFNDCTSLTSDLNNWNTGTITDMRFAFAGARNFNGDISSWDVSNVTLFGNMFTDAWDFNGDISNWTINTSAPVNMVNMFSAAGTFDRSLANWDISQVTNLSGFLGGSKTVIDNGPRQLVVGLSTANYDATLIAWSALTLQDGLTFEAGKSRFCAAAAERQAIEDDFNWTINDLGIDLSSCPNFVTTWKTDNPGSSNSTTITIPLNGTNITVDWGDGTLETGLSGPISHTYGSADTYTVAISGGVNFIRFNGGGDAKKLLTIEEWGDIAWTSFQDAFRGCSNLQVSATDAPDLSGVTILRRIFNDCTSLTSDLNNWNTGTITDMRFAFANARNFNGNISSWDVSKVTQFGNMFTDAWDFNSDISNWTINTSSAVNMTRMFSSAGTFDRSLANWDISQVTNLSGFFGGSIIVIDNGPRQLEVGLSTANYDATLIAWSALTLQNGLTFDAGKSQYCAAAAERQAIEDNFDWTINDLGGETTAPTASCQNITLQLDASGNISTTAASINDGSSDECGIKSLSLNQSSFSCDDLGDKTVTLTVEDNNGNTATCNATVTIEDLLAPTALCQDITVQLDASGNGSTSATSADNGSTDNCEIQNLSLSQTSFDCTEVGANPEVLTVTDAAGNTVPCNLTVTVIDGVAPEALCQEVTVQLDASGNGSTSAEMVNNNSNDACGIGSLSLDNSLFTCDEIGNQTVTLTVTDENNNVSTCQANVVVEDKVGPVLDCDEATVNLDANGTASITAENLVNDASDACGIASYEASQTTFSCQDGEEVQVTVTVKDNNGNSSDCQVLVAINDPIAPTASCQNVTIQLGIDGTAPLLAAQVDNGSSDNCEIEDLSIDKEDYGCEDIGDNIVTLLVKGLNDESSCQATVTVLGPNVPIASCQNVTIQLDDNGAASISSSDINTSSDPCGVAEASLDQSNFTCDQVGDNTVTLTLTDNDNNTSTCQATVTVNDGVAPEALCQDVTVQLDATGNGSTTAETADNGSNDACGIKSLSLSQTEFDCSHIGSNTLTLTVKDNNDNTSSCLATVNVEDNIKPTLTCPQDMIVNTDLGECGANVNLPKAVPTDNCGIKNLKSRYRALDSNGNPTESWSAWASDHSGFFNLGSYQVQWRAKDNSNNKGFCSFRLDIIDEEAPEVICQDITINFNGEDNIAIISNTIFDAEASSDACGPVSFVSQSLVEASCSNVGEALVVEVVGVDPNGNTSSCTAQVTVVGMPCGFEEGDIDCENGASATYDPEEESFTLTADDCSGYPQGEYSIVQTELCGNGEIVARVASLGADGRVGVIMMENQEPGARMVAMVKDLTRRVRTEYRSSTDGTISYKGKNRSGVDWLRIVRTGSKFKTYTSTNGSYWRLAHTINFSSFDDCVQVGLFVYTKDADEPVTAVFDNVEVSGDNYVAHQQLPSGLPENASTTRQQLMDTQLQIAPNPFATQTQIEVILPTETDVLMDIYNLHGQRVQSLENARLDAGTHRYEWDGNSSRGESLPTGIYMLRLRAGKKWITTKISKINR